MRVIAEVCIDISKGFQQFVVDGSGAVKQVDTIPINLVKGEHFSFMGQSARLQGGGTWEVTAIEAGRDTVLGRRYNYETGECFGDETPFSYAHLQELSDAGEMLIDERLPRLG